MFNLAKKAIGFIDGNNFYHNARKNKLLYQKTDFSKIIKFICKEHKLEYAGFYYYNSVPSIKEDEEAYYEHMKYLDVVRKMDKSLGVITRKLKYRSAKETLSEYYQQKQKLEELPFCDKCKKNMGPICFECVLKKQKREKGIDVKIAIDIIEKALGGEYDACILLSGDSDFIPALELVKKKKKEVISSFIACKGYSRELQQKICALPIDKSKFKDFLIEKK